MDDNCQCDKQVSLVHGIAMGGGASFMVPMKFSVVTEKTVGILILVWCFYAHIND